MGVLVAADLAVCDQGSIGVYAAAGGVPVIVAQFAAEDVAPGSASALLATSAPRLRADRPLADQFGYAEAGDRHAAAELIAGRITSQPGRFHRNVRRLMYRLLRLRPPGTVPSAVPADPPVLPALPVLADWSD
jgi:hypothetical protein